MSLPKILGVIAFLLLVSIAGVAAFKKWGGSTERQAPLNKTSISVVARSPFPATESVLPVSVSEIAQKKEAKSTQGNGSQAQTQGVVAAPVDSDADFPAVDRLSQLFSTSGNKLPIVETITYASRVDWLKGRPAWIADYATYYATSRHFIARSLNGHPDYFTQKVSSSSRFNVFRRDKDIQFYLLVDVSRAKMGLYYFDIGTKERVLLKTYPVGLGRKDPNSPSGCLTPLGTYSLGGKIAIYKPGIMGQFLDQPVEMVRVFGTRWIPFEREFEGCTAPAKGYGLHGAPFQENIETGQLVENRSCIGMYDSDGCIRLTSENIEEIFAIVVTKPSFLVIVNDFRQAKLPGVEVITPSR